MEAASVPRPASTSIVCPTLLSSLAATSTAVLGPCCADAKKTSHFGAMNGTLASAALYRASAAVPCSRGVCASVAYAAVLARTAPAPSTAFVALATMRATTSGPPTTPRRNASHRSEMTAATLLATPPPRSFPSSCSAAALSAALSAFALVTSSATSVSVNPVINAWVTVPPASFAAASKACPLACASLSACSSLTLPAAQRAANSPQPHPNAATTPSASSG
mmetsp:Transcript_15790/g.40070  ORF Transcript_15790/g.40070 Transcript_15790/m.40070 type:complete len:222 (+) Transcript_15790:189-854(+)